MRTASERSHYSSFKSQVTVLLETTRMPVLSLQPISSYTPQMMPPRLFSSISQSAIDPCQDLIDENSLRKLNFTT